MHLVTLAEEAGLNPIECPYCRHRIKTIKAFKALMRAIMRALKAGHTVVLPTIGAIYMKKTPARRLHSPLFPEMQEVGPRKFVSFRQSNYAKRALNGRAKVTRKSNGDRIKEFLDAESEDQG
jgi:nucleoid DNA-binding protein